MPVPSLPPLPPGTARTMCPMNCHPTLCGMLVKVRKGELDSVAGDPDNPDSQGFLCIRGKASREIIGNPARLLYPMIRDRRGAALRRASWDEALGRIADGMREPDAVGIWPGHGTFTSNYGTRISAQLMARFANQHGSHFWSPTMVCWGLGAFGLALTGLLETNTKEDMGAHSQLVLLWGANLASQPNTARHLMAARQRGAFIVAVDVRQTEATAKADQALIIRAGSDNALALAMMNLICTEQRHDAGFVARHTVGFEQLAAHLQPFTPDWAAPLTGLPAATIVDLARRYAATRPAMIVLGGSSMHKGDNGWLAGRAIACLPALTGNVGIAGGGFGPRHGSAAHGRGLGSIIGQPLAGRRGQQPDGGTPLAPVPSQMSAVTGALLSGRIRTLLLPGTNMLSSFADAGELARALARTSLVVSYDLFLNDTARQFADIVLPATAWLEELGCKMTHTHLYLMDRVLAPPGECRTLYQLLTALAQRLELTGFAPWASEEAMVDAILDHPCTGHATVAALRAQGGIRALDISHVANPTLQFDTPSGRIEFFSEQAARLGLPPLPGPAAPETREPHDPRYPLTLAQGRTMNHFHSFYNNGSELPTLARREFEPALWMSPQDAAQRRLADGAPIRIHNQRGELAGRARVSDRMPAGTVWMRDGWPGLNRLSSGVPVLPDAAVELFAFSAGQASYAMRVDVAGLPDKPPTIQTD